MCVKCAWEHNGNDTLLYAMDYPGAYTRGSDLREASEKMNVELRSFCTWAALPIPENTDVSVVQNKECDLQVRDADSDVLFDHEREPLTMDVYQRLKMLALRSAADFLTLYEAIPEKDRAAIQPRMTFYGNVPRTAEEMYRHTKNVNAYYFGELGIDADNEGNILECRSRGFDLLEMQQDYLKNHVLEGSYGELWSLRKLLRRFLWHDRIHAKAMYRMAITLFDKKQIPDIFHFGDVI